MFEQIEMKKIAGRNNVIEMRDLNQLNSRQIDHIKKNAKQKTELQWKKEKESVDVSLTREQKQHFINTKNIIFKGLDGLEALELGYIDFSDHAFERIAERVELKDANGAVPLSTKISLVNQFIDSKLADVESKAKWKGRATLSYGVRINFNKLDIVFAVAFQENVLVVTIIDKNESINRDGKYIRDRIGDDHALIKLAEKFKNKR